MCALSNFENTGAAIVVGQGGKLNPIVSFIEHEGKLQEFHGGAISSATLMNVTIENLTCLLIENLDMNSLRDDNNEIGDDCCSKMSMVDNRLTLHDKQCAVLVA